VNRAARLLLAGEGEALTRKAVELALAGDPTALRLCLERIVGPYRERVVEFTMPSIGNTADLASAMAAVADATAQGAVTPREAMQLGHVFEAYVRAVEAAEFERRLRVLEAADAPSPLHPPRPGRGAADRGCRRARLGRDPTRIARRGRDGGGDPQRARARRGRRGGCDPPCFCRGSRGTAGGDPRHRRIAARRRERHATRQRR